MTWKLSLEPSNVTRQTACNHASLHELIGAKVVLENNNPGREQRFSCELAIFTHYVVNFVQ